MKTNKGIEHNYEIEVYSFTQQLSLVWPYAGEANFTQKAVAPMVTKVCIYTLICDPAK